MYVRELFKKIKSIYAEAPVTTLAGGGAEVIDLGGGFPVRVQAVTGPIYISTLSTTPLTSTGWRLNSSGYLDLYAHNGYVALYSTSTGGTRQVLVFQD